MIVLYFVTVAHVLVEKQNIFNANDESSKENIKAMVRAQNDLYMVTPNALEFKNNLVDEFNKGNIAKSELQRNAKNILNFVLNSLTFRNKHNLKIGRAHV